MLFKGIEGILFDFGGTLDSDGDHWLDRFYEIYRSEGIEVDFSELKSAFYFADDVCYRDKRVKKLNLDSFIRYHVEIQFKKLGLNNPEKKDSVAEKFSNQMKYYLKRNREILKGLSKKYKLGIVSNFYGNLPLICKETGLLDYLDVIVDSGNFGIRKPYLQIFLFAISHLRLPPQKVVFIGDSLERDIFPCKKLGIRTVWLKGQKPRIPKNPPSADAVITSLKQVESLLR